MSAHPPLDGDDARGPDRAPAATPVPSSAHLTTRASTQAAAGRATMPAADTMDAAAPQARPAHRIALPAAVAAAIVALAVLPHVLDPYTVTLVIPAIGYAIALLGFNLLFGYTGLLSFGHALFVAIGAYGAAVLSSRAGVTSFEAILAISCAVAVAVALPVALLAVRYVKIFFGILTLAFGMLFHSFLFKFYDLTGGDTGIRVAKPTILGMPFADLDKTAFLVGPFYDACVVLLVVLGVVMWRIVHSPFGLHLVAVRENARKAEYLGVRVRAAKVVAFVISALYGAVGGAILAVNTGQADPELAYWTHSGDLVFMAVLGGFANFFGPVVGAFAFVFLKSQLMSATEYWRFFLGLVLAIIVVAFPRGLTGIVTDVWRRIVRIVGRGSPS